MNFEIIIKDIDTIYQETHGDRLTEQSSRDILCALLSVRDTERIVFSSSRHLIQSVFESKDFYNKCVYPCDIVQLRGLLLGEKITSLSKIIMFSNSCSEKIIKDQKVRLVLKFEPNQIALKNKCNVSVFGGMAIFDCNVLNIKDMVNCIVVEGGGYEQVATVNKIVTDIGVGCPVYTTSFIPGVDKYKFAASMKKFIINLSSLGIINEHVRSTNALQALQDALSIRWQNHPDSEFYKRRPENYSAEYWSRSGYIDSIVRERGSNTVFAAAEMPKIQIMEQVEDYVGGLQHLQTQADTMAKSEEGDQKDFDLKNQHLDQMKEYLNRSEPIQMKPLVDDLTLQKMFPNLPIKLSKWQPSFINFVQEKLMEKQFEAVVTNSQQAIQFIESIRADVESMYNNPDQDKQSYGWYRKAKIANAESSSHFGVEGRLPSEGSPTEMTGVKKMIYRHPGEPAAISLGDRYRSKGVGVAFEPGKDNLYKIVAKGKTHVIFEDSNGKKSHVEIGIELPAKFIKV